MADETTPASVIRVEVVHAMPQQAWTVTLELPSGATASDAVAKSDFATRIRGFDIAALGYAVFGRTITAATVLRDGDRLELLRPLIADPKQARRRRAGRER